MTNTSRHDAGVDAAAGRIPNLSTPGSGSAAGVLDGLSGAVALTVVEGIGSGPASGGSDVQPTRATSDATSSHRLTTGPPRLERLL
jgi:hypothetical protein